ncbi:hypothetical protein ACIGKL_18915 [Pseudomonas sp. NPDC077186]|uniref:hypothetical protein n=1 Tax=Pseudomonas sp. NPDC077186 TaxID=3364421 RepID=UPI0037C88509
MNETQRLALERAFPSETRDSITTFVIENREVLDALRALLDPGSNDVNLTTKLAFPAEVNLKGGIDQLKILFQLAAENGLEWLPLGEQSSPDSAVFGFPGRKPQLTVRLALVGDLN